MRSGSTRTIRQRSLFALAATVALLAGLIGAGPSAEADGTATPWVGTDQQEISGLTFYNSAGDVITGGSTTGLFAAYAQGRHLTRTNTGFTDTLAALYFYLPEEGKTPDTWGKSELVGPSSTYPDSSDPGALGTSTLPVYKSKTGDVSLDQMTANYPSTTTTAGYAKIYEVRMTTGAFRKGFSLNYDYADISVNTSTHKWQLVYSPSNAGTPAGPTGVAASPGNGSASVSWTAPSNGGSAITSYVVEYSADGGTTFKQVVENSAATTASITGLTAGTSYLFRVRAVNASGPGDVSSTSAAVTPTGSSATAPGAPTNVTATAGISSANVTWTAPTANGGSPITGYQVGYSRDNGSTFTEVPENSTATAATITGLTAGTPYVFHVEAVNAVGTSTASANSGSVTPTAPTTPTAPSNVTAVPGDAAVTVSWFAPSSNGGSPITGYQVGYATNGSTTFTPVTLAGTATRAVISGLTNGTSYVFRVTAINSVGTGTASTNSTAVTPTADASALSIGGPSSVRYGYTATITAKLTDSTSRAVLARAPVTLYGRHARSGRWYALKTVTTSATGTASFGLKPSSYEQFYWHYSGTATHKATSSAGKAVYVSQTVAVKATATKVKAKKLIKVYGTVGPTGSGQRVYLQVYRHGWKTVTSAVLRYQKLPNHKRATGYVLNLRPRKGSKVYRVYKTATASLLAGASAQFHLAGK